MKTKLLVLLLVFSAISVQSQTVESLKTETLKFYEGHYYMDFKTVADLTHPIVLENTDTGTFIQKLDNEYQNTEFRKRLQLVQPIFSYTAIKTIDGQAFCVITYKNPTRYFFEQKLDAAKGHQKVSELKQSTKATEVIFEPVRNSINVKRSSKLVAVWDESAQNQWKFFNFDDPMQEERFQKRFNEYIKKAIGL